MSVKIDPFLLICIGGVMSLSTLAGCTRIGEGSKALATPLATPTTNPLFERDWSQAPAVTENTPERPGNGVSPTAPVSETSQNETGQSVVVALTPSPTRPNIRRYLIYDETLDENWTLENSNEVNYDLHARSASHAGDYSLSFTPMASFSSLLFSVRKDTQRSFLSDQVLGVSFWLYSGEGSIKPSDLAISVYGSNQYTYWVLDDPSVTNKYQPKFSETRLYFLGINHDIPPHTWVQIELWLDDILYDPEYKYVTGILIKNDQDFYQTTYIDQVELLLIADPK